MKKIWAAALAGMLFLAGCQTQKAPKSYAYTEENGVMCTEAGGLHFCLEDNSVKNEDEAVYQLEQALQKAQAFLGAGAAVQEDMVCYLHAGEGVSQQTNGQLNIYYYGKMNQPYINYMIQLLAGTETQDWLREGLAAYGAEQMGESLLDSYAEQMEQLSVFRKTDEEEVQTGITVLAQTLYRTGEYGEALKLGDMMQSISQMESAQKAGSYRAAYCIYAGSFVEYLIDQYGQEALLQEYQQPDKLTGSALEAEKQMWIEERLAKTE